MLYDKKVTSKDELPICYFRTSVKPPYRKALIQITERCNLNCEHCFVNAESRGIYLSLEELRKYIVPALKKLNVVKVTLTGGEPFIHSEVIDIIELLSCEGFCVGICTNGTLINDEKIMKLRRLKNIHINVSLDGFRKESHGVFRGNYDCFNTIIDNIKSIADNGLLQGILVTPNTHADINEYTDICKFAKEVGAKYVLMNPLSNFGRGNDCKGVIGTSKQQMKKIKENTIRLIDDKFEINYIRFPEQNKKYGDCEGGNIIYIFSNGDVTNCPYVVFACKNSNSRYDYSKYICGNVFKDTINIEQLEKINFNNKACSGCLAAIISSGQSEDGVDYDIIDE